MIDKAEQSVPASRSTALEELDRLALGKIEAFEGTIDPDGSYKDPIYQSARSASLQIAADYGFRFLLELVQNAHDVQPVGSCDGAVKILFDPGEGEFGCLYVANSGRGFTRGNVKALCNIGLSSKPVGEAIGNKGLGFRSTVHITDDPHIYSKLPGGTDGGFDGYCFRFARPGDFERWIRNRRHLELAERDIPPFHVPLALSDIPHHAALLSSEGFVTVIRLPLRNSPALQVVRHELAGLRQRPAPVLLFLQRLRRLDIVVLGEPDSSYSLTRTNTTLPIRSPGDKHPDIYTIADLGDAGRFLLVSTRIPEARVRQEILSSIEEKSISPTWSDWSGDGEAAVAASLDDISISPLLYTFLPLGNAVEAPFHGFLNGSFYPESNRMSLRASIPLNALYIREAAALCARATVALQRDADGVAPSLSREQSDRAQIDLLCWKRVPSLDDGPWRSAGEIMADAFAAEGLDLARLPIVPVVERPNRARWATLTEAWRWRFPDLNALGLQSLASRAGVPLVSTVLGRERLDRLDEFGRSINRDRGLDPSPVDIASAIEKVAQSLGTTDADLEDWRSLYRELKIVCARLGRPVDLHGRAILLCSDRHVRPTQVATPIGRPQADTSTAPTSTPTDRTRHRRRRAPSDGPAVFVPSRRAVGDEPVATEVLEIPRELSAGFAFLADGLDWYGDLDEARTFLGQQYT